MPRISVVVASESDEIDILARGIAGAVAARADMTLIRPVEKAPAAESVFHEAEIEGALRSAPSSTGCALVLVCRSSNPIDRTFRFLTLRPDLVVVEVTTGTRKNVRIGVLDPRLPALLSLVHDLVNRIGTPSEERVSEMRLDPSEESAAQAIVVAKPTKRGRASFFGWLFRKHRDESPPLLIADAPTSAAQEPEAQEQPQPESEERQALLTPLADEEPHRPAPLVLVRATDLPSMPLPPLFQAAVDWLHAVLGSAIEAVSDRHGDALGVSVTRATLLELLSTSRKRNTRNIDTTLDEALEKALQATETASEPLATAAALFELNVLELKYLVLALAPELDVLYQRCIGFLLDDMSRRTGTRGLYCSMLGPSPNVRRVLAARSSLSSWLVFESGADAIDASEPLRVDGPLVQWLVGDRDALAKDPRVRRVMRPNAWLGRRVLRRREEYHAAYELVGRLIRPGESRWIVLGGDDPAGWRALLEFGARRRRRRLIRVDGATWAGVDPLELEDAARRIGRMQRLNGDLLIVDLIDAPPSEPLRIERFLSALESIDCRGAIICEDVGSVVHQLGTAGVSVSSSHPISREARVAAFRKAARRAGATLNVHAAQGFAERYPLGIDAIEAAMNLAAGQVPSAKRAETALERFAGACQSLAAEGHSPFAEWIDPVFRLQDVVLPSERKQQLEEIVDHVRLAPKVFDDWNFGKQLPYGRGVAALFFGPSGTGKTMAAMGVARELEIPLLRFDLSRVVSKYIGDTEKNIDRIFEDAKRSGAAILIDEADAILGKRSEVKDAHDRYANIEVAYLLQRMEVYEGLAILTTNMRQNLDPAFLRRLRFIIEFPRPDQTAREIIWRFCLPDDSHKLDDAAFRVLARRIDLTGGHIRQITLHAAFTAAAAGRRITLADIEHAARAEFAKLGMPPVELVVAAANPNRSAA